MSEMVSEAFAGLFAQYEEHLRSQRDLSEHTIRAYIGDLTSLAEHAQRMKVSQPSELTLAIIRSWLANQQSKGGNYFKIENGFASNSSNFFEVIHSTDTQRNGNKYDGVNEYFYHFNEIFT